MSIFDHERNVDSDPHGSPLTQASAGEECDFRVDTLAAEALADKAAGRPTFGTRGWADYKAMGETLAPTEATEDPYGGY